jgi:hypothetical protein
MHKAAQHCPTDTWGNTATSTRTVLIEAASSSPIQ